MMLFSDRRRAGWVVSPVLTSERQKREEEREERKSERRGSSYIRTRKPDRRTG